MGKDRNKEDKEFEELANINGIEQLSEIKNVISKIIPNSLKIIAKNHSQIDLIKSIKNNEITVCAGAAGTGKTYVALGIALGMLRKKTNKYKKIYLVKSVKALKDEELGFVPGDLDDKIKPAMWSFFLNMEKIISPNSVKSLIKADVVRPTPLAFIRGATLDNCIIITDEMQNVSLDNSRTLLTRIGENSKIILLGDINQVDMKYKYDSSLKLLLNMFEDTKGIGVIKMSDADTNIRNPIISVIENKYNEHLVNKFKPVNGKGNLEDVKQQLNG